MAVGCVNVFAEVAFGSGASDPESPWPDAEWKELLGEPLVGMVLRRDEVFPWAVGKGG
jgi:hypothetical protein